MKTTENNYVEVFNTTDESEFLVVKALLESEGIRIQDVSKRVPQFPVNIDGMGLIRLYVIKEDEDSAIGILKSYYEKESGNMWKCPKH